MCFVSGHAFRRATNVGRAIAFRHGASGGEPDIRDPETSEFITLARVVKTQGRRGEVASEILSDIPGRFSIGMLLFALQRESDGCRREMEVEELWPHKGLLVLKFVGED